MKTTIIVIVIVLVILLGAYLIISNTSSSPATNSATTTPVANTPTEQTTNVPVSPAPAAVSVSIKNFAFSPAALNIKAGTTVTWTNNDSVAHTVTSDSGNLLNSGMLAPGQSYSFTFTQTGVESYHCSIHPMMKGAVTVS